MCPDKKSVKDLSLVANVPSSMYLLYFSNKIIEVIVSFDEDRKNICRA